MSDNTIIRAFELPIHSPLSCTWEELRPILANAWSESTSLANWAVATLLKNDVTRTPEMKKLPAYPIPKPDSWIYQEFCRSYCGRSHWDGSAIAASSLLRRVLKDYKGTRVKPTRFKVLWMRDQAPQTYRYPHPYPVHPQSWRAVWDDGPVIEIALPGAEGRSRIRLRQGQEFGRQLAIFRKVASGEFKACECQVYRRKFHGNSGQSIDMREAGGGRRESFRVMFKLVVQMPRPVSVEPSNILDLRTSPDCWLLAQFRGRGGNPHQWHRDDLRRLICAHRQFLQSFSEDTKFEKRWPTSKRRRFNESREERCRKHRNRLKSAMQETVASVVSFCLRNRISDVAYDSSDKSYFVAFPWFQFREMLKYKLEDAGVGLIGGEELERPSEGE